MSSPRPAPLLLPLSEYRTTLLRAPRRIHRGADAVVHGWLGARRRARLARAGHLDRATAITAACPRVRERFRTAAALGQEIVRLGEAIRRRGVRPADPALIDEVLAALAVAAARTVHLDPHPVQIAAVLAIEEGTIVEMATGEGKTLTIGLAAALAAFRGRPVHVVTANDYLVRRDCEWLEPFYGLCGLSAGHVIGSMTPAARREQYGRDVAYVTSKELVADFLRDRLQAGDAANPSRRLIRSILQPGRRISDRLVLRGLDTAIVDEADHVLVDEAVTPLLISRPGKNTPLDAAVHAAGKVAEEFAAPGDYRIDDARRDIELTSRGRRRLEASGHAVGAGIWAQPARREELVVQALVARHFFRRGREYLVDDQGKIVIVDEFTGRAMPNRTWQQGLHQAIEAKEGIPVTPPTETLARLSFQRFFRLFRRLSGLTGTAREARAELWHTYHLPFVTVPTHRPCIRERLPDRIFADERLKWDAVVAAIVALHAAGRPVLAGTRSVAASEHLADLLAQAGLEAPVLNAERNREEAAIVAEAGRAGRITIATNMAGRGTDIKLGGGIAERGGLHVIATEAHESGRIDRQLFGRCARQGEPGSCQLFASLEDELVQRHLTAVEREGGRLALRGGAPGSERLARRLVHLAQWRASRLAFRRRQQVHRRDEWLSQALSFGSRE